LVGEEQYGLETVMEVEDDRGWNRFWGEGQELFSAARRKKADRAETRVEFSGFLKLVSWGTGDEGRRRTEQDLSGGEGLDDDHRSPTFGTDPETGRMVDE